MLEATTLFKKTRLFDEVTCCFNLVVMVVVAVPTQVVPLSQEFSTLFCNTEANPRARKH